MMAWDGEFTQVLGFGDYSNNGNTQASCENGPAFSPPENIPPPTSNSVTGNLVNLDWAELDDLPFRVIIQPKVEGASIHAYGGTSCPDNWMEVDVGDAPEEIQTIKLFAMAADPEHVGCRFIHGENRFILYFNTEHPQDHLVLRNCAEHILYATAMHDTNTEIQEVKNWSPVELGIGEWAITANDECLVEVKVLKREHWPVSQPLSTKRDAEEVLVLPSKARLSPRLGRVREDTLESWSSSNDILSLRRGDKLHVGTGESSYELTHIHIIADNQHTRVCRAKHSKVSDRTVAVKIIKTANAGEDATVNACEAWMHEIEIYSCLGNHFAITEFYGSDARFHCIYTEYVEGNSLFHQRDPNFRFTGNTVRAWRILSDMAAALSYIHGKGIVHADIKPDNILFNPIRGTFLIDFGVSFKEGSPRQKGGSPWYLPPEFLSSWESRDKASDIWALGVVMMWVLDRIPLPESTKSWNVGDIHSQDSGGKSRLAARAKMEEWICHVLEARLNPSGQDDEIHAITNGLIEEDQSYRVDAETLVQQINSSNLRPSYDTLTIEN